MEKEKSAEDEEISMYRFTSSMQLPLESCILLTTELEEIQRRMRVLHEPTHVLVGPLQNVS